MQKINNSTTRIWTNADLKETVKQCKAAGFVVTRPSDMLQINDPSTGAVVLRSLPYQSNVNMVRIDQSYFES